MTEQEAIRKLNMLDEALNFQRADADESSCALQMAIKALEKQVAKKPRYQKIEYGKHKWKRKENGEIDDFAWDHAYCNGVVCEVCGLTQCVHCNPDYDDLEDCGNFRVYFWAYASGSLESVYISVDSLEIEKEMEYCQEEVELPEEPESSSSVLEECSEMKMKTITLSTIASEQNRFADFEQGITSAEAEGMQVSLSVEEDILFLNVEEKSFELGEEYGNFRAGVVPEQVCEESLDVFPGTLGSELEIFQNAWVILKSEKKTYLLLIGKRTDAEGGSSVEITYWE